MHLRDLFQIQTLDESMVYCGFDFLLYLERYRPRRPHDGRNGPGLAFVSSIDSGISHTEILDR